MSAFLSHFSFEFRTGIRNKQLLFTNYLFPLGFYLLVGFVFPTINPPMLETLLPAMVVFTILAAALLGLPDPLVNARETGILRSYKINGIPAISILAIPALTTIVHLAIACSLITATASPLFSAPLPGNWHTFLLVFLTTAFSVSGISVLIGVISSSTRMTVLWSQTIFVPSMMLGGLMLPYRMLPEAVSRFSMLLPSTHAMNAFNGLAMGRVADFSPWGSLLVLVLTGTLAFALAIYLFSWDRHNAARRGHPALAALALLPLAAAVLLMR